MKKLIACFAVFATAVGLMYAADEITIQATIQALKNYADIRRTPSGLKVTWTGTDWYGQTVNLTTNPVALAKGDIGSCGYSYWRNLSSNHSIALSFDVTPNEAMRLKAGEYALLRLGPSVIVTNMRAYVVGSSNETAVLDYVILED